MLFGNDVVVLDFRVFPERAYVWGWTVPYTPSFLVAFVAIKAIHSMRHRDDSDADSHDGLVRRMTMGAMLSRVSRSYRQTYAYGRAGSLSAELDDG